MTKDIREIFSSKAKHKEQVAQISQWAGEDKKVVVQVIDLLKNGTDVEKGTAAEVLKFVSKDHPGHVIRYIDVLIEYIDYKAPRVRWGCPESIGNLAAKYPSKVEKAIPKLIENLKDKSTVVRWCAAYALAEIARYNKDQQARLASLFTRWIKTESNSGVRNVYFKALKEIEQEK